MDRGQFTNLMKGLKSAYPNFSFVDSKEGMEMWYTMLKDLDYKLLSVAIQTHIATSKYPPSIAEIREITSAPLEDKDWSEGWELVLKAIRQYGTWRIEEALEFISEQDPLAADIAKRLDFKELCLSENLATDRANFRMAYEKQKEYDAKYEALPPNTKLYLDQLQNKTKLDKMTTESVKAIE